MLFEKDSPNKVKERIYFKCINFHKQKVFAKKRKDCTFENSEWSKKAKVSATKKSFFCQIRNKFM